MRLRRRVACGTCFPLTYLALSARIVLPTVLFISFG